MEKDVEIELIRATQEELERTVLDPDAEVTASEAARIHKQIVDRRRFENTVYAFLLTVAGRDYNKKYRVVMNSQHQEFIRWIHQKYQTMGLYKGGKNPELMDAPIVIDDMAQVPRLELVVNTVDIRYSDGNKYELRRHVDGGVDVSITKEG